MTGHLVDCHVLAYRGRADWLDALIASLADQPCRVHVIPGGSPDHIGRGRAMGLALGGAPYVMWMDDDDLALPGAVAACLAYLEAHPACVGAYTDWEALHWDGRRERYVSGPWSPVSQLCNPAKITHLKVMRRRFVEPYLEELTRWPTWEEAVLCGLLAAHGPWGYVPMLGAVRRLHRTGAEGSMRLSTEALRQAAVRRIAPVLLHWRAPS